MYSPVRRLQHYANIILAPELHYGEVRQACNDLFHWFSALTDFSEETNAGSDLILENGKALGPGSAALCLLDFMRTRQFIMGIRAAIDDRMKSQSGNPLILLYAGTGPFASLLTPICSLYSPEQIQLVLLEFNSYSYKTVLRLFDKLELNSFLLHHESADACNWKIPDYLQPDILISETMNKSLEKEPQVKLVSHLIAQCILDPILIPTAIKVSAALVEKKINNPDNIFYLKELIRFDKEMAASIGNRKGGLKIFNEGVIVDLPADKNSYADFCLLTEIEVYGGIKILSGESAITLSVRISSLDKISLPSRWLFQYEFGNSPGFRSAEMQ